MKTLSFDVDGMTCGGCSGSVQRTLSQLSGIRHAEVTLTPGVVPVVVAPTLVTSAQIESAITGLGYPAKVRAASDHGINAWSSVVTGSDETKNPRAKGVCCGDQALPIFNQSQTCWRNSTSLATLKKMAGRLI